MTSASSFPSPASSSRGKPSIPDVDGKIVSAAQAVRLIRREPDPVIERIVAGWAGPGKRRCGQQAAPPVCAHLSRHIQARRRR